MDELHTKIAGQVTRAMQRAGMSRTALADAAGIPYATLSRRLQGVPEFGIGELVRIAGALGVEMDDLLSPYAAPASRVAS